MNFADQLKNVASELKTKEQTLKIMLLKGTDEQVFSAAKEIGMVSRDLAETPANLAVLKEIINSLAEIFGGGND